MIAVPFLAVLMVATAPNLAQVPTNSERYVPAGLLGDADDDQFYERWFGNQLRAMREPILSRPGDRGHFRRRFRLLVLPNYHPAYAVRIDETSSGGRLRYVRLDGAGGYAPGRIARQEVRTLGREDLRLLNQTIRAFGLETLTPSASPSAPAIDPETGEQVFTVCLHDTYYVLELSDARGNWLVKRGWCEMPQELRRPLRELLSILVEAGLR